MHQGQQTADEQEAYNLLYNEIHAPIFFEKLAERGIVPQTEQEVDALLNMGASLMQSQAVARQKQAQAQGSFILKAAESLDAALADRGLASQAPAVEAVIKRASYTLAKNEQVRDAALAHLQYIARRQAG